MAGNFWYDSNVNNNLNTARAGKDPYNRDSNNPTMTNDGKKLVAVSTNINIYANGMRVGFVQSFSPSESRTITPVQELGTEGVVQMVAGNTNGGTIELSRICIYNANLFNALGLTRTGQFVSPDEVLKSNERNAANIKTTKYQTFGNPFKTLKDQRVPLEIRVEHKMPGNDSKPMYETYIDCWITRYGKTIASNTITVTESCSMTYSDII